jgi:hypothetical protein
MWGCFLLWKWQPATIPLGLLLSETLGGLLWSAIAITGTIPFHASAEIRG